MMKFNPGSDMPRYVRYRFGEEHIPAPDLDTTFDEFNARYFGGALPKYQVFRAPGLNDDWRSPVAGWTGHLEKEILIEKVLPREDAARSVLLHEMVHVAVGPDVKIGHGPEFVELALRLIREEGCDCLWPDLLDLASRDPSLRSFWEEYASKGGDLMAIARELRFEAEVQAWMSSRSADRI